MKLGIIVAEFNKEMTEQMLAKAEATSKELGIETTVRWVPGVYDMPLQAKKMLPSVDALALLGVVKKGLTAHDVIVAENTARLAADLSLEFNKPVTLGIIGPDASQEVAADRLEGYAKRAVKAAFYLVKE
ncbi:MAG: 6,7-dimethyl-8-ribityllumazine synthase [Candidatus Diapherotrites archaeon]|nr:6,7-dimethyl-8-ribityllumazine synthase [Candidatus Diapherotrites archaeon]